MPWEHQELGHFEYRRRRGWVRSVDLPGFAIFTWPGNEDRAPGTCELRLGTEDENDLPSPSALALVSTLLNEQQQLPRTIAQALWEDFNGRGPDSGMWWHGHLEDVDDMYDSGLPAITGPDALMAWLELDSIDVRNAGIKSEEQPVLEVTLGAPFEIEHGVGVLTDGVTIIGIGYAGDVERFKD